MDNSTTFQGEGEIAYIPVVISGKQTRRTNADRFRSLSNWEMAKFLVRFKHCAEKISSEGILEWLEQECAE